MADKRKRDPFSSRYDAKESEESQESDETEKTTESNKMQKTSKTEKTPLRERTNINMYIESDELVGAVNRKYKRLDLDWSEKHGEDLPKNDEFYPALLRAALNETSIEEELGLEE